MSVLKIKDGFGNFIGVPTLKGDKGLKGDTGDTGAQGIQGPKGDTGDSAVFVGPDEPVNPEIKVWVDSDAPVTTAVNLPIVDTAGNFDSNNVEGALLELVSRINTDTGNIYGVRIDKTNSNPDTRVTYIKDAVGLTPMSGGNGTFSWGGWSDIFKALQIKPCLLKSGNVNYYLNPNDYTKKLDGTASDITTGSDGDVMVEFGKPIWYKWTDEGTTFTVEISDKFFVGSVCNAFEIELGYNLFNYYPLLLTQILFCIFFKSTNGQISLGQGLTSAASGNNTGQTNTKGLFWGSTDATKNIKFLGIEDYYGNLSIFVDGAVTDASINVLLGKKAFNDSGVGYVSNTTGLSTITTNPISKIMGGNDLGFLPSETAGSTTTYYCDFGYLPASSALVFGGSWWNNIAAGPFCSRFYVPTQVDTYTCRLFYSTDNKFYVGAYLGCLLGGKLRSLSGSVYTKQTLAVSRTAARNNN